MLPATPESVLDGQYPNPTLHATAEAVGGCIALMMARLLVAQTRYEKSVGHYVWVATALVGMGTLDLFHACANVNASFYWTRALATAVGGVAMSTVWLPARWARTRWLFLPTSMGVASFLGGVALLHWANAMPRMFHDDGRYFASANVLNIVGGVGFVAAACNFLTRWRARRMSEDSLFASFCLLFGAGSLLFTLSHMWGAVWWFFHVLRLAAYVVLARFLLTMFHQIRAALAKANAGLEERVRARTRELELEKTRRERYVAALAHDLRNPLNAASLSAHVLARTSDDDKQRRAAARVVDSIARATQLIEDLLDANRITAGHLPPLELERCELASLLRRVADEAAVARAGDVRVRAGGELVGNWSCRGLHRVFENLVGNAVKYGERGKPVTVAVERDGDEALVRVSVHNFGAPIPAHEQAAIFEEGVRGDAARRAGEKGWGIGLTIVRGYVEAHGGRVTMRSDDDGTVFTVELPLDARPHVRATPPSESSGAPA